MTKLDLTTLTAISGGGGHKPPAHPPQHPQPQPHPKGGKKS